MDDFEIQNGRQNQFISFKHTVNLHATCKIGVCTSDMFILNTNTYKKPILNAHAHHHTPTPTYKYSVI
jgi:hypothetical protein